MTMRNNAKDTLPITTIVLAGGMGTRLKSIVEDTPKVLAPVAGHSFLHYLLSYLRRQGITDVILCTGYQADQVYDYCGDGSKWGLQIRYSSEHEALGTGGAIKNAAPLIISNPFIVLNGDSIVQANLNQLVEFHEEKMAQITIALTKVQEKGRFGSVALSIEDSILGFKEKGEGGKGLINAGIYVIARNVLDDFPVGKHSIEHDIFPLYVNQGLFGKIISGSFIDIGTPESYEIAQMLLAK